MKVCPLFYFLLLIDIGSEWRLGWGDYAYITSRMEKMEYGIRGYVWPNIKLGFKGKCTRRL